VLEANDLQLGHVTEDPTAEEISGIVVKQSPPARLEADKVPFYDKDGKPLTRAEREKIRREMQEREGKNNNENPPKKKKYKKGEFDPRPRNKIRSGEIVDLTISANPKGKAPETEEK
ncbi:MAG: hypothetical protein ACK40K_04500, partial [Raineya sp.]